MVKVENNIKDVKEFDLITCADFEKQVSTFAYNVFRVIDRSKNENNESDIIPTIFTFSPIDFINEVKEKVYSVLKSNIEKLYNPNFFIDSQIILFYEKKSDSTNSEYKATEREFSIFITINLPVKFIRYYDENNKELLKEYKINLYITVSGLITKVVVDDKESIMVYLTRVYTDEQDIKFQIYYSLIKYLFEDIDDPDKKLSNIVEVLYKNLKK